jgi:hypothetical protein
VLSLSEGAGRRFLEAIRSLIHEEFGGRIERLDVYDLRVAVRRTP